MQRSLALNEGYAPTWTALYEDAALQKGAPLLAVQRQALAAGPLLRPPTPLYAQLSDVMQRQANAMITGQSDAVSAMTAAQERSDALIQAMTGTPR
jgi:multiple sugar transport system substrate-binding protein